MEDVYVRRSLNHLSFVSIFLFLLACVFSDMRVTSGGQTVSFFAISVTFMSANFMCVLWILFIDDEKLRGAFTQFHDYLEKRRKKGMLGKKVRGLGALGLKLAVARGQQTSSSGADVAKKKVKGINSLLGSIYTISPFVDPYITFLEGIFSQSDDAHRRSLQRWYVASLFMMAAYAILTTCQSQAASIQAADSSAVARLTMLLVRRGPARGLLAST